MTKILVIEDEESIRENILELLNAEEFEALGAENGQIGIELAYKHQPNLILCDVMMPEVDGYGVLEAVRSNPETTTIPFIFLTAKADKADTRKGMELGADDYLTKPCTADELLAAIATRLEKQAALYQQSQKKLDELRTNITHSLPHELRTPLNGIMGFAEILLSEYDSLDRAEIMEMLEQIQLSSKRLYRLIVNFLLYAELELLATNQERIQAMRNCQVNSAKTAIEEQANQEAQLFKREADLQINLEDASLPIAAGRLKKIIEELIENACKFSLEGTPIHVRSVIANQQFVMTVSNEGRGMTPEQIARIGAHMQFERKLYEQQGSGLGLIIVKRLAELHGGGLAIESVPDEKITVSVSLPLSSSLGLK
ncbi:MAG: response regulator [Actinomycetota bacterium]